MHKTILITDATSGIGYACTIKFITSGWRVIATGRRGARLGSLAARFGTHNLYPLVLDVRQRREVEDALTDLPAPFSQVDVLLNNAGLALGLDPAHEADLDQWEEMIDTNIKGLTYCTRVILPGMVKRRSGHIINIGSGAGDYPSPGGNTYGATKAFVKQFSRNLRADLNGTRVRVTNIEPGMTESEFSLVRFGGDQEKADKSYMGTKPLTPKDIAEIVFWTTNLPPHININRMEVMPICQSHSGFDIDRDSAEE